MKSTICRRVCREIEEAAPAHILSDLSLKHLNSCSACQSFLDQRLKMSELLGTLLPVKAPEDFDVRLRARLAALKQTRHHASGPYFLRFNVPSVAVAMMLLLAVAAFLWRVYERPTNQAPAKQQEVSMELNSEQTHQGEKVRQLQSANQAEVINNGSELGVAPESRRKRLTTKWRTSEVASVKGVGQRTVSKDFSSVPAPVLTGQQPVANSASVFPIETSYQALKLSLTDVNGVPRTISVPAVSFGSQRVLTGNASPTAQNSAKGDW